MSCEGCIQKLMAKDEVQIKIVNQAIAAAKRDNAWYVIYIDEFGQHQYINAAYNPGKAIRHVSPQMQYLTL